MGRALTRFPLVVAVWIYIWCGSVCISRASFVDGQFLVAVRTTASRAMSRCVFPDTLRLRMTTFPGDELDITTNLIRHHTDRDVPMFSFAPRGLTKISSKHTRRHGFYFSIDTDAHLQVTCGRKSNGKETFSLTGTIIINSQEYVVSSNENPTKNLLSVLMESWDDGTIFAQLRRTTSTYRNHDYIISEKSVVADNLLNPTMDIQISRLKRDVSDVISVTSFTVEVLAVIDYSVFKTWKKGSGTPDIETIRDEIRSYYEHVFKGVDHRYRNIGYSEFKIRIALSGLVIIETYEACPWTIGAEDTSVDADLNADLALTSFKVWLNETKGLPVYDHAVLLTKYDLYTSARQEAASDYRMSQTSGLAFIGTVCDQEDSVSIVEEQGGFQSIGTVAHEIGHSLGALHDGENNTCMSENRYIMAASGFGPVPEVKKFNPWFFSECSVEYFRHFISKQLADGSTCLLNTTNQSKRLIALPGQLYNPDEQCKLIWGPKSYLCRGAEFGNASTICTSMYCRDPSTASDCVLHTAARGTSCGNQQWCKQGLCVYSADAPEKRGSCILGDQPGPAFNGQTCAELVSASISYCYQDKVRARCCETCGARHTLRKGCEYGDRIQGCTDAHCTMVEVGRDIQNECCGTCNRGELMTTTEFIPRDIVTHPEDLIYKPTDDVCEDHGVTSGDSCEQFIKSRGRYVCYDDVIFKRCCLSCSRSSVAHLNDCAFGDRTPDLCSRIANKTRLSCPKFRFQCCDSCIPEILNVFNGTTSLHDAVYRLMTAIGICFTVATWIGLGS